MALAAVAHRALSGTGWLSRALHSTSAAAATSQASALLPPPCALARCGAAARCSASHTLTPLQPQLLQDTADVLVVGAGHNGLVRVRACRRRPGAEGPSPVPTACTRNRCTLCCQDVFFTSHSTSCFPSSPDLSQVAATLLAKQGLEVHVLEEKGIVGGACRTEYPFPKAPGLPQSTGAADCSGWWEGHPTHSSGRHRQQWLPVVASQPAPTCSLALRPALQPTRTTSLPACPVLPPAAGAYLLGVMPPELLQLLGLDLPLRRRSPHYFLPTTGDK